MGLNVFDNLGTAPHQKTVRPQRRAVRTIAVAGSLLFVGGVAGCDNDSSDETFETPNDVEGNPTEGTPAGGVDSRDDGTPDGE